LLSLQFFLETRYGICSWYGAEGEIPPGWPTACGEPFDRFAMKAASWPELPCGTRIRVTDEDTGRNVIVTVNDRFGGAPSERIVDLTYGAFGQIGNHDAGLIRNCKYEVV
jgi:rare lipoprotein A